MKIHRRETRTGLIIDWYFKKVCGSKPCEFSYQFHTKWYSYHYPSLPKISWKSTVVNSIYSSILYLFLGHYDHFMMTDKHKIYIIILWFSMRIYCKKNEFDIYNSLEVSHLPRFLEFSRMCGLQRALKSLNSTATAACHFALGPVYIRSFSMADEGSYLTHCHTHAHSLAVHRKTSVCPRQMVGRLRLWIEWVFNVGLRKFFIIFFFFFFYIF